MDLPRQGGKVIKTEIDAGRQNSKTANDDILGRNQQ